jgi:protein-S-isoprenylcysteine O-methyltransferase Ste14/Flp pilus assembly pilin Flp
MGRRAVIAAFAILTSAAAAAAVDSVVHALRDSSGRAWLDVAYLVLKLAVVVAFTVLVVRRGPARERTHSAKAYLACAASMAGVLPLERPDASVATGMVVGGELFALVAVAWMLASTLALGRCFGVLPEARGLVTRGPYRFVRHPLYLGEFGACAGLVFASPSGRNLVAAAVFGIAQTVRMEMEEAELTRQFPEYKAYAALTPRLIPRVLGPAAAEDGQALFEYAAILGIVSIVGIAALTLIGGTVNVDLLQIAGAF